MRRGGELSGYVSKSVLAHVNSLSNISPILLNNNVRSRARAGKQAAIMLLDLVWAQSLDEKWSMLRAGIEL